MTISQKNILKHILRLVIILSLLTLGILYPFMNGEYDRLAMPLSILIQGFGVMGLLLSVVAIFWLFTHRKHQFFAQISVYVGSFLVILLVLFAYLTAGILLSVMIMVLGVLIFVKLSKNIKKLDDKVAFSFVPIYLISIPLFILILQLLIAKPITDWSRERSMANAKEYISDIENFKSKYGYYPKTLQAMYHDYFPNTVGVEKYHYLPFAETYNISFEQPRFLFDVIGTKEWVVYNPQNEHRVYSHTAWFLLLSPEESAIRQGWYESHNTKHKNWKSFFFD